jgi:type II secretory pathway pseudopilin PulG
MKTRSRLPRDCPERVGGVVPNAPLQHPNPKQSRFKNHAPHLCAFTLIELLVAAGITALLTGFIVVVVANVSGFWSRTSGRVSAEGQARYVLDQLALDLQSALYRDDGNPWLAATVLTDMSNSGLWDVRAANTALLKPASAAGTGLAYNSARGIEGDTFGLAGTWLRFFTTKRGANSSLDTVSAPVAVGWQIIRRAGTANPNNTDRRYFLHRAEARPVASDSRPGTLDSGFDIMASAYASNAGAGSNSGALGDPHSIRSPQDVGTIVAENVIDFGVRLYVRDPVAGALTKIFPASATDLTHLAVSPPNIGNAGGQFPEVVEVMVRILSDEGARLIADLETGRLGTTPPDGVSVQAWWWQIALAHSHVFSRRILIVAHPS